MAKQKTLTDKDKAKLAKLAAAVDNAMYAAGTAAQSIVFDDAFGDVRGAITRGSLNRAAKANAKLSAAITALTQFAETLVPQAKVTA